MSDRKSANRTAWARSEGIYEALETVTPRLRCLICGRELHTSALVRASHGKRHVREGKAVARTEYDHDGPRTVFEFAK